MKILSPAFKEGESIPSTYSCESDGINPPLQFSDIPSGTISLALIVEDPDAPTGAKTDSSLVSSEMKEAWIHWLVWNINSDNRVIKENSVPNGYVGKNSGGNNEWYHICPPSGTGPKGDGEHRYYFTLFALDTTLQLDPKLATRNDFYDAIEGHIIDQATLMGVYKK